MHRSMASSSSSSTSTSRHTSKQHKKSWTRDKLLESLQILPTLGAPLPPNLPPSPPASRESSPRPSHKRKYASNGIEQDTAKRLRIGAEASASVATTSATSTSRYHHSSPQMVPAPPRRVSMLRADPTEDGELSDGSRSTPEPNSHMVSRKDPIRRPKQGKMDLAFYDALHDKYFAQGRALKYSGDQRIWATYPASSKDYRPLPNPPPTNSNYHKHGSLIARLELVDALVCFTYAIWNKEYTRKKCGTMWNTMEKYITWCKQKWSSDDTIGEREKSFLGLVWMIEGFIEARKLAYRAHYLAPQTAELLREAKASAAAAAAAVAAEVEMSNGIGSSGTPPMLPSPASIVTGNSASSTPNNVNGAGQPNSNSNSRPTTSSSLGANLSANTSAPIPPMHPNNHVKVTIRPALVGDVCEQTAAITRIRSCMEATQSRLDLAILARNFPSTFSRIIGSKLGHHEEYEPDFEDEEGELYWPGQASSGEGLGWVCLMGKAMVKEFGRDIGYRGIDGVVPKPKMESTAGSGTPDHKVGSPAGMER